MTNENSYERWQEKAEQNVEKWGVQRPEDVILAIIEETAEIVDEITMQTGTPVDQTPTEAHLHGYLLDIAATGRNLREWLENNYEDKDGEPLPPDERPQILDNPKHPGPILEEVDDLGPLVLQLEQSVKEYSEEHGERT